MQQGREYWSQQVAEWRCSGLSKKAYCEQHGVPVLVAVPLGGQAVAVADACGATDGGTGADRRRERRRAGGGDRIGGGASGTC